MSNKTAQAAPVALVIDDEPQMRRLLRVTLEANGYRVFDAATGNDGVAQAAQRKPDVVLLDLGLPDLDGAEVLKRLREWSRVPVIILSVRDREDDKEKLPSRRMHLARGNLRRRTITQASHQPSVNAASRGAAVGFAFISSAMINPSRRIMRRLA